MPALSARRCCARGAGTSLAGQCCNVAVVLDFTKYMNRILEIDPAPASRGSSRAWCSTRCAAAAEQHGLTFGPDPSTHSRCTLGGHDRQQLLRHAFAAGGQDGRQRRGARGFCSTTARELTVGATPTPSSMRSFARAAAAARSTRRCVAFAIATPTLIRARFPRIPRRVSGYNLDRAAARERLPRGARAGRHRRHLRDRAGGQLAADRQPAASRAGRARLRRRLRRRRPRSRDSRVRSRSASKGFEGAIVDGLRKKGAPNLELLPAGGASCWSSLARTTPRRAGRPPRDLIERLSALPTRRRRESTRRPRRAPLEDPRVRAARGRRRSRRAPRWEGWDDAAVAPDRLGPYLRELRRLLDDYGYQTSFYGHFGHGCIHMRVTFDLETEHGIRRYGEFVERAADLVVRYGGSLSGEHGDGQSRGALLPKMFGPS